MQISIFEDLKQAEIVLWCCTTQNTSSIHVPDQLAPGLTAVWIIHLGPPIMASSVPSGRAHRAGGRDGFLEFISFGRAPLCVMMINTANPTERFVPGISIAELTHWLFHIGFGDIVQHTVEFIWGSGGQLHKQAVVMDHLYSLLFVYCLKQILF